MGLYRDLHAFLSTLSLRRATKQISGLWREQKYFYPRSPCGERPVNALKTHVDEDISIHALLAESDLHNADIFFCNFAFLSTLSLRRATGPLLRCGRCLHISIHALLAESDRVESGHSHHQNLFLSTLSLRRATVTSEVLPSIRKFLSTLSLRRATRAVFNAACASSISIHALLAESD